MASKTKLLGDIGVSVVISEFLKHGINVLLPYDDNSPYDIVIYVNNEFYKIQVKTTEKIKFNEYMEFEIQKTNPYTKTNIGYNEDEVDYFALYCVENNWCGLVDYEEHFKSMRFRIVPPSNNQIKNVKYAEDYDINIQLKKHFNVNHIKENIIHNEAKIKRNIKTKVCPICNEHVIKYSSSMCRDCYLNSIKTK